MIRVTLLWLFIAGASLYAFRDWYKSLCALIILGAVLGHEDMPASLMGIQGLSPWNILFVFILMGLVVRRSSERLKWDMPNHINILLVIYLIVIFFGFIRMIFDYSGVFEYAMITGQGDIPSTLSLTSEYLINTVKFALPGLLLFYGCNSRSRFVLAVLSILMLYFFLALFVIRYMPIDAILQHGLSERASKILERSMKQNRDTLSMLFAGAFWAVLMITPFLKSKLYSLILIVTSLIMLYAQALTGGRGGYVAWIAAGMWFSFFRWRKYIVIIPLVVIVLLFAVPQLSDRILHGFTEESVNETDRLIDSEHFDGNYALYTITSGRSFAWPYVIDKILASPFLGYGRLAMKRTGIATFLMVKFHESFPHPHNAYLQCLLDNGLIGTIPIFVFFFIVLKYSMSLFRDKRNPIFIIIGGMTLAFVGTMLIFSFSAHTFYPEESVVGMWCVIGLMFRIFMERLRNNSAILNTI